MASHDAIIVGSGPNGLAAAIVLARAGRRVLVHETAAVPGGGARTEPLTLPGFLHDVCSAVHPLAVTSPFLRELPLERHGLRWLHAEIALAHPLDDAPPALLYRSLDETARGLGGDASAYRSLMQPLSDAWEEVAPEVLAPLHLPRHPIHLARFGLHAIRSGNGLLESRFRGVAARALLGGMAAHSMIPLDALGSSAFALVLALAAHHGGWPIPAGGSGAIAAALISELRAHGGTVELQSPVESIASLDADLVLLDVTPRQALAIVGNRFSERYRRALARYRYGPGAFKVDWALDGPVPWRSPECARAASVHVGGTLEEIAAAESQVARGEVPERPFLILAQPSSVDDTRAPRGRTVLWGYCHVPHGSREDMMVRMEAQIERFAPRFRERVLARHVMGPDALEAHNANLVGGDIAGGRNTLGQLFFRPTARRIPYATSIPGLYLCSASTPPGGGVHGMCGFHAATAALRRGDRFIHADAG